MSTNSIQNLLPFRPVRRKEIQRVLTFMTGPMADLDRWNFGWGPHYLEGNVAIPISPNSQYDANSPPNHYPSYIGDFLIRSAATIWPM